MFVVEAFFGFVNDDRFNEDKFEQLVNMKFIFVTLEVDQLDKSIEDKFGQSENMAPMFVTLEVDQLDKLSEDKLEQP